MGISLMPFYERTLRLVENPNLEQIRQLEGEIRQIPQDQLKEGHQEFIERLFLLLAHATEEFEAVHPLRDRVEAVRPPDQAYFERLIPEDALPVPQQQAAIMAQQQARAAPAAVPLVTPIVAQGPSVSVSPQTVSTPSLLKRIWNVFVDAIGIFIGAMKSLFNWAICAKPAQTKVISPQVANGPPILAPTAAPARPPEALQEPAPPLPEPRGPAQNPIAPVELEEGQLQLAGVYQGTIVCPADGPQEASALAVLASLWDSVANRHNLSVEGFARGLIDNAMQTPRAGENLLAVEAADLGAEQNYMRKLQKLDRMGGMVAQIEDRIIGALIIKGGERQAILIDNRQVNQPRYYHFDPLSSQLSVFVNLHRLVRYLNETFPIEEANPFQLQPFRIRGE